MSKESSESRKIKSFKENLVNRWRGLKDKTQPKLRDFFAHQITKKEHPYFKKFGILLILLILSLTFLSINRSISYNKYERIQFNSAGSTLYANLYYPTKSLSFQDKKPLIIFCHGIGSKRDFDLRVPIEFTKRGFYVAALDYQGHGESSGNINKIDSTTNVPALAQDCTKLLDKLETLPFYTDVNTSQIGLIGHSLGGMVVLMNQALDPRFNVTVAWSPLVNFVLPKFGFQDIPQIETHLPVNLIDENNTHNLLLIMHKQDEVLNFTENAIKAQELTNCTLISITDILIGGGHQLFSNSVLISTIHWFEFKFFKSETINGHIDLSFIWNYILVFTNLIILIITILVLIAYTSMFFTKEKKSKKKILSLKSNLITKVKKPLKISALVLFSAIFVINWQIFAYFFGSIGILYASLIFCSMFIIIHTILYFIKLRQDRVKFTSTEVKRFFKREFKVKYIIYAIVCSSYFIIVYLIFSYSYPFGFMWPSNFNYLVFAELLFPVYLSLEILFRKVLYPQLNFVKSEKSKSKIIMVCAIIVYGNLMFLTQVFSYLPSVLFTYFIFLITTIINTIIYENTRAFSFVLLCSFNILQLFFSAVISNIIGVGAVSGWF
ncbi:MAG: alpha/beta hydrolase [Promethearchaeota archaeon]|jgi:predicted esterase